MYLRVSSDKQATQYGLASQLESCISALNKKYQDDSYAIAKVFQEAASGFKQHHKRHELRSALDLYEVSPPDARFEARLLDLSPSSEPALKKTKQKRFAFDLRLISSAGIAFACAAFGVLAGLSATAPATTTDHAEAFMSVAAANYDTAFWGGDEG